ncbi:glycosyltransferase family 4 protein [Variovorax ureilyticus]|uniref:Glycosyltransferase family 4 protein n=1 Tax=Variovorax ureilyticus TaxID=1836198 RepID=A0ABU8VKT4_9BURK
MRVLVIHQNFPGQFRHIAQAWASRKGWQVIGIGRETAPGLQGVRCLKYRPHRLPHKMQHPYLRSMESAVLHGQAVARLLQKLKSSGFVPDVILAHPGWGETMYAKSIFPKTRLIHFCEWYYQAKGADFGFDPEFPSHLDDELRIQTWNALHLLNLEKCDIAVTPTNWQHAQHPEAYREKIVVAHEGIGHVVPDAEASFALPNRVRVKAGDPVITYVARNLEPYRGFHCFMRALERIQARHPSCQALIVGGDDVSYGRAPESGQTWREQLAKEVRLDPDRTHFLGRLPYAQYLRVLQVSAAHVYLTYPFVLSWSLLEAMSAGCLIVASDTAPVREVVRDGHNGLLVDFFDDQSIAERVLNALESPSGMQDIKQRAREGVLRSYRRDLGLRTYDALVGTRTSQFNEGSVNVSLQQRAA